MAETNITPGTLAKTEAPTVNTKKVSMGKPKTKATTKPTTNTKRVKMGELSTGESGASRSSISYGTKQDLFGKTDGPVQHGSNPYEILAQQQSGMEKLTNTGKQILPSLVAKTVSAVGFVGGGLMAIPGLVLGGSKADALATMGDNFVVQAGHDYDSWLKASYLPVYKTDAYKSSTNALYKVFGEGATGLGDGLSFLGSAALGGGLVNKLNLGARAVRALAAANRLAKVGKLAKAEAVLTNIKQLTTTASKGSKTSRAASQVSQDYGIIAKNVEKLTNAVNYGAVHLYNTTSEAAFEAFDVRDRMFDEKLWESDEDGNLLSGEAIKDAQFKAWQKSFGYNMALLALTNIPETSAMVRTFSKAKMSLAKANKIASKTLTTGAKARYLAKGAAITAASEGLLEEGGQMAIENAAMNDEVSASPEEFAPLMFQNWLNNFSTVEGQEAMLTGALIGFIPGAVGNLSSVKQSRKEAALNIMKRSNLDAAIAMGKNSVFESDKDGNLIKGKDGQLKIDVAAVGSLVDDIRKVDAYQAGLLQTAADLGSQALYNHVTNRAFMKQMSSSVSDGYSAAALRDDVDYFLAEQADTVSALNPGVTKEQQAAELEALRTQYYDLVKTMVETKKKANALAYTARVQGKIEEEHVEAYAIEAYGLEMQAISTMATIRDFSLEIAGLEDKFGLTSSRDYNRKAAEYQYQKNLVSETRDNLKKAIDRVKEIKGKLEKAKDPKEVEKLKKELALEQENVKQGKEYVSGLQKTLDSKRKTVRKAAAEFSKTVDESKTKDGNLKDAQYNLKSDTSARLSGTQAGEKVSKYDKMTNEQLANYQERVAFLANLAETSKDAIETRRALDSAETMKEYVDAHRKNVEETKKKDIVKIKKSQLDTFKENLNKVTNLVGLEPFKVVADEKEGEYLKAYNLRATALKAESFNTSPTKKKAEETKLKTTKKEAIKRKKIFDATVEKLITNVKERIAAMRAIPDEQRKEDTFFLQKFKQLEAELLRYESNNKDEFSKLNRVIDKFITFMNEKFKIAIADVNKHFSESAKVVEKGARQNEDANTKEITNAIRLYAIQRLYAHLNNNEAITEELLKEDIQKFTDFIATSQNNYNAVIKKQINEVYTTFMEAEALIEDDITNEQLNIESENVSGGYTVSFIPFLHDEQREKDQKLTKAEESILDVLKAAQQGDKVTLKSNEYDNKASIDVYIDGVLIGHLHSPEIVQKQLNKQYALVEAVGETKLNKFLYDLGQDYRTDKTATMDAFLEAHPEFTASYLIDLAKRAGVKRYGKISVKPANFFNDFTEKLEGELDVVTDAFESIKDGELIWEVGPNSAGAFVNTTEQKKVSDYIDNIEDYDIVYVGDDGTTTKLINSRTGKPYENPNLAGVERTDRAKDGMLYIVTDKTLNGTQILVPIKPDVLDEAQQKSLKESIKDLIGSGKGEEMRSDAKEAIKNIKSKIFYQADVDSETGERNNFASNFTKLKESEKRSKAKTVNSQADYKLNLKLNDGSTVMLWFGDLSWEEGGELRTASTSISRKVNGVWENITDTDDAFDSTLDEVLAKVNSNVDYNSLQNEGYLEQVVSTSQLKIQPLLDSEGKVTSFTQPRGTASNVNFNYKFEVGTPKVILKKNADRVGTIMENLYDTILEDTAKLTKTKDDKFYKDEAGNLLTRVTSYFQYIFSGTDKATLMNTASNFGTVLDEVARKVFAGLPVEYNDKAFNSKFYDRTIFASEEQFNNYVQELRDFKEALEERGETIFGGAQSSNPGQSMKLSSSTLGIAGEVDLLTYDKEGKVRLYDMKSMRGNQMKESYANGKSKYYDAYNEGGTSNEQKHTKQLSLYAAMLKEQYGIEVESMAIVPIIIGYPSGASKTLTAVNLGEMHTDETTIEEEGYFKNLKLRKPIAVDSYKYERMEEEDIALMYEDKEGNAAMIEKFEDSEAYQKTKREGKMTASPETIDYNKVEKGTMPIVKEGKKDTVKAVGVKEELSGNKTQDFKTLNLLDKVRGYPVLTAMLKKVYKGTLLIHTALAKRNEEEFEPIKLNDELLVSAMNLNTKNPSLTVQVGNISYNIYNKDGAISVYKAGVKAENQILDENLELMNKLISESPELKQVIDDVMSLSFTPQLINNEGQIHADTIREKYGLASTYAKLMDEYFDALNINNVLKVGEEVPLKVGDDVDPNNILITNDTKDLVESFKRMIEEEEVSIRISKILANNKYKVEITDIAGTSIAIYEVTIQPEKKTVSFEETRNLAVNKLKNNPFSKHDTKDGELGKRGKELPKVQDGAKKKYLGRLRHILIRFYGLNSEISFLKYKPVTSTGKVITVNAERVELIRQVDKATGVFVTGKIVRKGTPITKGGVIAEETQIVGDAATSFASAMVITQNTAKAKDGKSMYAPKPLFVYDVNKKAWFKWTQFKGESAFMEIDESSLRLSKSYLGLGSTHKMETEQAADVNGAIERLVDRTKKQGAFSKITSKQFAPLKQYKGTGNVGFGKSTETETKPKVKEETENETEAPAKEAAVKDEFTGTNKPDARYAGTPKGGQEVSTEKPIVPQSGNQPNRPDATESNKVAAKKKKKIIKKRNSAVTKKIAKVAVHTVKSIVESYKSHRSLLDFNELTDALPMAYTEEQLVLIDKLLAAVSTYSNAAQMVEFVTSEGFADVMDVITDINSSKIESLEDAIKRLNDVDIYDLGLVLVINNLMAQGRFSDKVNTDFITETMATVKARDSRTESKEFTIAKLTSEARDIVYDIESKYREHTSIEDYVDVSNEKLSDTEKVAEGESSVKGNFLSRTTINNNFGTLTSFLTRASKDYTAKISHLLDGNFSSLFEKKDANVTMMIKPLALENGNEQLIREFIIKNGGKINRSKTVTATNEQIAEQYKSLQDESFFGDMVEYYNGKDVVILDVAISSDKVKELNKLLGSTTSFKQDSNSLRSKLVGTSWKSLMSETGVLDNGIHVSSIENASSEAGLWFDEASRTIDKKWYNIGLGKQDSTLTKDNIEEVIGSGYNLFTPTELVEPTETKGKYYNDVNKPNTTIIAKPTLANIKTIHTRLKNNANKVVIDNKQQAQGIISFKVEDKQGNVFVIDLRSSENVVKRFDKGTATQVLGRKEFKKANAKVKGGYGIMFNLMRENLKDNSFALSLLNKAENDYYANNISPNVNLFSSLGGFETISRINIEKTNKWVSENMPNIEVEIQEGLIRGLDGNLNYGMSSAAGILLSDEATFGSDYHEALHYAVDYLIGNERRDLVLTEIQAVFGLNNVDDAHEVLADLFRNYQLTNMDNESLPEDVKLLLPFINETLIAIKDNPNIKELFEDLNKGRLSNSAITEAQKERYSGKLKGMHITRDNGLTFKENGAAIKLIVGDFLNLLSDGSGVIDKHGVEVLVKDMKEIDRVKPFTSDGVAFSDMTIGNIQDYQESRRLDNLSVESYHNDIIYKLYDKMVTKHAELVAEYEASEPGSKREADLDAYTDNLTNILDQFDDTYFSGLTMPLLESAKAELKDVYGYSFRDLQTLLNEQQEEIDEAAKFDDDIPPISALTFSDALDDNPETTFRPVSKYAVARLVKQDYQFDENGNKSNITTVPNLINGENEYVDFGTFFPKMITSLVGVTTIEELNNKLLEKIDYIPEFQQLYDLIQKDENLAKSLLVDLNKQMVEEIYVKTTDFTIRPRNTNGKYAFSNKWIENVKVKLYSRASLLGIIKQDDVHRKALNAATSLSTRITSLVNRLNNLGIPLTEAELYFYGTDPNNATKNLISNQPIKGYADMTQAEKFDATLSLVEGTTRQIIARYIKISKAKTELELEQNKRFNSLAAIKHKFGKEGIKLSYLDVSNNQKNEVNINSPLSTFFNILEKGTDEKIHKELVKILEDKSLEHSNLLLDQYITNEKGVTKRVRNGLLTKTGDNTYVLNREGINEFRAYAIGGLRNDRKQVSTTYKKTSYVDGLVDTIAMYVNGLSEDGQTTLMQGIRPGDASNNFAYRSTIIGFGALERQANRLVGYSKEGTQALLNAFKQEETRMEEALKMFDRKADGRLKLKNGAKEQYATSAAFMKDYHYYYDFLTNKRVFIKNGKPAGNVFHFFSFEKLNDLIDPYTGIYDSTSEHVANLMEEGGFKSIDDLVMDLISQDLRDDYNNMEKDYRRILKETKIYTSKSDKSVGTFIANMMVNQRLFNLEFQNMFIGTTAEFATEVKEDGTVGISDKGRDQVVVRTRQFLQGGTAGKRLINGKHNNAPVKVGIIRDVIKNSNTKAVQMKYVKDNLALQYKKGTRGYETRLKNIEKSMSNINSGDGGGWISLNRWAEIQDSQGRFAEYAYLFETPTPINPADPQSRLNYKLRDDLTFEDYLRIIDVIKPVYSARETHNIKLNDKDGNEITSNVRKQEYLKMAQYPLLDIFTKNNPELKAIQEYMENTPNTEHYDPNRTAIDSIMFESAEKQGATYINNITNEDGTLRRDKDGKSMLNTIITKDTNFEDYRIQLELTAHSQDSVNKLGVQIQKSIIANIFKDAKYNVNGVEYTGAQMIDLHFAKLGDITEIDYVNTLNKLDIQFDENGEFEIKDIESIRDIIVRELKRTGLSEDVLALLETEDGQFVNALDASSVSGKIMSVLNAQFSNNVKNTKFNGAHLTLIPDTFVRADSMVGQDTFLKNLELLGVDTSKSTAEELGSSLRVREANGKLIADILIPAPTTDYFDKNGKHIPMGEISPELLRVLGYRIPNTGKHSNVTFNVVGFTPHEAGGIIVTPSDFVGRTGWDFDVDSVYMMYRQHMKNPNEESDVKYVKAAETNYSEYKNNQMADVRKNFKDTEEAKAIRILGYHRNVERKELKRIKEEYNTLKKDVKNHIVLDETKEDITRLTEKLATIQEDFDAAKIAYEEMLIENKALVKPAAYTRNIKSRRVLENELFDIWEAIQTSDEHMIESMLSSSFGTNTVARDRIRKIVERLDNVKRNPTSVTYQSNIHRQAVMDKDNLAIFANIGSMLNIHQTIGSSISHPINVYMTGSDLRIAKGAPKAIIKATLQKLIDDYAPKNPDNYSEYSLSELTELYKSNTPFLLSLSNLGAATGGYGSTHVSYDNVLGESITQMVGEDIDNAADAIKDNLIEGLNSYTKDVYSLLKSLGTTTDYAALYINQPILKDIYSEQEFTGRTDVAERASSATRIVHNQYIVDMLTDAKAYDYLDANIPDNVSAHTMSTIKTYFDKVQSNLAVEEDKVTQFTDISLMGKYMSKAIKDAFLEYIQATNMIITESTMEEQLKQSVEKTHGTQYYLEQLIHYSDFLKTSDGAKQVVSLNGVLNVDKKSIGVDSNSTYNVISKIEELNKTEYGIQTKMGRAVSVIFPTITHEGDIKELIAINSAIAKGIITTTEAEKRIASLELRINSFDPSKNPYPSLENKLIKANITSSILLDRLMLSENRLLRSKTTGNLFKYLSDKYVKSDTILIEQKKMVSFIKASLSGQQVQDFTTGLYGTKTDNEMATTTMAAVQNLLDRAGDKIDNYSFLRYLSIHEAKNPDNTLNRVLRMSDVPVEILDELKAESDRIFAIEATTGIEKEMQDILKNVLAISYKISGMNYNSNGLHNLATSFIKSELGIIESLNNAKAMFETNPTYALAKGEELFTQFIMSNLANDLYAPRIFPSKKRSKAFSKGDAVDVGNGVQLKTLTLSSKKAPPEYKSQYIKMMDKKYIPTTSKNRYEKQSYTIYQHVGTLENRDMLYQEVHPYYAERLIMSGHNTTNQAEASQTDMYAFSTPATQMFVEDMQPFLTYDSFATDKERLDYIDHIDKLNASRDTIRSVLYKAPYNTAIRYSVEDGHLKAAVIESINQTPNQEGVAQQNTEVIDEQGIEDIEFYETIDENVEEQAIASPQLTLAENNTLTQIQELNVEGKFPQSTIKC